LLKTPLPATGWIRGSGPVGLPWPSIVAFVTLVTNPRIFEHPESIGEAWRQVTYLARLRNGMDTTPNGNAELLGEFLALRECKAILYQMPIWPHPRDGDWRARTLSPRNGREAHRTFCRSAPTGLAGQRVPVHSLAGCVGHRASFAPSGLKLSSAAELSPNLG